MLDNHSPLRAAIETETRARDGFSIDDDLFCAIYRIFFQDLVTDFISSVIAAKIRLLVPVLPAIDPTGQIAGHIASHIAERIPTPCQERGGGTSHIEDIARPLVTTTLQRALGIPVDEVAGAA